MHWLSASALRVLHVVLSRLAAQLLCPLLCRGRDYDARLCALRLSRIMRDVHSQAIANSARQTVARTRFEAAVDTLAPLRATDRFASDAALQIIRRRVQHSVVAAWVHFAPGAGTLTC